MRFTTSYRPAKLIPPPQVQMANMGKLIEDLRRAGILLSTEGVAPGGKSARLRRSGGKFTATDGPVAETKELIGGYAILQVQSTELLTVVSRRFLEMAGESDAHQMFEGASPMA